MRVTIVDPYVRRGARVSKDTNGGFGTVNAYGGTGLARLLTWVKARSVDWPPLHALYTAAVLRRQGHDVRYTREVEPGDADLVLVPSSIVCHETEVAAVRALAARGRPVGVIGPFASSVPAPYVEAGAFVVSGEPEWFFAGPGWSEGALAGVLPAAPGGSLDDLPLPAWDLAFAAAPPRYGLLGGRATAVPILATRGCPYSCLHYCTYPLQQGRTVRARAPEAIVEEMTTWQRRTGETLFVFRDPVFSINRRHTLALCEAMERSGRRFRFVVETHLRNMDEELARRLRANGLEMVKVGVESVDREVLKDSRRFFVQREAEVEAIRMLERIGVRVTCFYMLAFPADTLATCRATIDYACALNTYGAQFSVFTPYPGTPAFADFEARLLTSRWEDFTQFQLVFRHEHLTPAQVSGLLAEAYRRYYTRPAWVWRFARARAAA
ncbi:MAG: radical SAM protein [Vicinamibacterales bacterium]|nr:radical SAM protein [Vicinamibacterales bacterium]